MHFDKKVQICKDNCWPHQHPRDGGWQVIGFFDSATPLPGGRGVSAMVVCNTHACACRKTCTRPGSQPAAVGVPAAWSPRGAAGPRGPPVPPVLRMGFRLECPLTGEGGGRGSSHANLGGRCGQGLKRKPAVPAGERRHGVVPGPHLLRLHRNGQRHWLRRAGRR